MSDTSMATDQGAPPPQYARFLQRLAASFVDGLLVNALYLVLARGINKDIASVVALVAAILYFVFMEGSASGQTLGKRVAGIKVVDINGGGSIGTGRAFGRFAMEIVSGAAILIGYLWMLWDPQKQTWHDKIAKSLVVQAK